MLVLSRKAGEEIVVNNTIRISIHKIQGGRVKIGIDAPEDVAIVRGELVFDSVGVDRQIVGQHLFAHNSFHAESERC